MKNSIKKIVKSVIPQILLNQLKKLKNRKEYSAWKKKGYPVPPPHMVKQMTIKEYQLKSGCTILIETGTYLGDMVEAQKKRFNKIFSIELGVDLFEKARNRFKRDRNVVIVQGDSGKILPKILNEVNEPAIFWLDGHYSGGITAKGETECPIFEELDAIFTRNFNHILLIDDARCFVGTGDYPAIDKLTEYIKSKNKNYQVEVKHDIIRYVI